MRWRRHLSASCCWIGDNAGVVVVDVATLLVVLVLVLVLVVNYDLIACLCVR